MTDAVRNAIMNECLALAVNETLRMVCPSCNAQHERSMAVTRLDENTLIYVCPRVKCGAQGLLGPGKWGFSKRHSAKLFKPVLFNAPTVELRDERVKYLFDKYEITGEQCLSNVLDIKGKSSKIVFLLRNYRGYVWGRQTKETCPPGGHGRAPKCILYTEQDMAKLAYVPQRTEEGKGATIVLVEDVLSAIKVAEYLPAVALLGTHLAEREALDIRKHFENIIVALDPDAALKAIKITETYRCLFQQARVLLLQQDPKDTPHAELRSMLETSSCA